MSVILFGLYTMFDQTQRALRNNTAQVDVLEAGRAAVDLISRDIEQAVASQILGATNAMARITYPNALQWRPLTQDLLTNQNRALNVYRTNFLQEFFFLTRYKDNWGGGGYFVSGSPTNPVWRVTNGIGTLYRFSVLPEPPVFRLNTNLLIQTAQRFDLRTNASPVVEGVVHFSLKAYDPMGMPMEYFRTTVYDRYRALYLGKGVAMPLLIGATNVVLQPEAYVPAETRFHFLNNGLPACLELELGIVEPQALERMKAFPQLDRQRQYLEQHAGKVQIFRKRIPIRPATQ
jgi:hypothetical protein